MATHNTSAFLAISIAPSIVLFPPMNPLACTNTHPSTPLASLNAASRSPLHASGSGFLLVKLPGATPTAWIRQLPSLSSSYTTYFTVSPSP